MNVIAPVVRSKESNQHGVSQKDGHDVHKVVLDLKQYEDLQIQFCNTDTLLCIWAKTASLCGHLKG